MVESKPHQPLQDNSVAVGQVVSATGQYPPQMQMQMQPNMMQQQQPVAQMMPLVVVQQAPTTTTPSDMAMTGDPELKCYEKNCPYVGTGLCRWHNCACRCGSTKGGCGRRFCKHHSFEKEQFVRTKHSHYTMVFTCCDKCEDDLKSEFKSNCLCGCFCQLAAIFTIIPIFMMPLWFSLASD